LFCAAVYLGMFENRQMNASKLADYVGMLRSTMDLERGGRVERRGGTGIEPIPHHLQGSPEDAFSRKIKAKRLVDVQTVSTRSERNAISC
jgi:hypothetical protein